MLMKCPAAKSLICDQGCGCCAVCERLKGNPFVDCKCGFVKKVQQALAKEESREDASHENN
jgi:hypothetical protein